MKKTKEDIIKEEKEKSYWYISPKTINGGATLVHNYKTLELYERIKENTDYFAKEIIKDLIREASFFNQEEKKYLDFDLIFLGDFKDIRNANCSTSEFIINNKSRVVAIYNCVFGIKKIEFFVGFDQSLDFNANKVVYLSLEQLLNAFEENNITYEIDNNLEMYYDKSEKTTTFIINYVPKKEIQLKRAKN